MAGIAENPQIGVVLRVAALRDASAGVRHGASALKWNTHGAKQGNSRGSAVAADSSGMRGAGWSGIATAVGAGAVAALTAGLVCVRSRRRGGTQTTRGSA